MNVNVYKKFSAWTRLLENLPTGITEIGIMKRNQFESLRVMAGRISKNGTRKYRCSSEGIYVNGKGRVMVEVTEA